MPNLFENIIDEYAKNEIKSHFKKLIGKLIFEY